MSTWRTKLMIDADKVDKADAHGWFGKIELSQNFRAKDGEVLTAFALWYATGGSPDLLQPLLEAVHRRMAEETP